MEELRALILNVASKYTINEFRYRGSIDIGFICKQYAVFKTGITEVNMYINTGCRYCHEI